MYDPNNDYAPLARVNHYTRHNSIEYYHSEVNVQPLELTDSDGTILCSATYNSWGKLLRLNQINDREGRVFGIEQPLRYAGQYADNETGLHYNTFRYYDPEVGRFTQQDPIGLEGGINLYQYAPNPLEYIDPFGLLPKLLPDEAIVCRGGACLADSFKNGSGVIVDDMGKLQGVSVNSAANKTLEQLSEGIPHNKVGVTTVGDIRAIGGDVIPSPTKSNPNHATLSGITADQAQELMTPTQKNPSAKPKPKLGGSC